MNKKGIFMPMLVIIMIILLSYSFWAVIARDDSGAVKGLGILEGSLVKSNYGIQKVLFYDEKKVDIMLEKTINEFNDNGGFVDKTCEKWKFGSECDPSLEGNFLTLFKENSGFDARFEDDKFIVELKEEVKEEDRNFVYTLSREIEVEKDFNLNDVKELKQKIEGCIVDSQNPYKVSVCSSMSGLSTEVIAEESISFIMENNKNYLFFEPVNLVFVLDMKEETQGLI